MTETAETLEIVTRREGHVVGVARDFTMGTRHQIPALYNEFFSAGYEIAHVTPGGVYGVSFGTDDTGAFRYGVGYGVEPVPETRPKGT